jgi:XTP/dITP diphosphohydrolase
MLDAFPDRSASAVSVLAIAAPEVAAEEIPCFRGEAQGVIAPVPRGSGGFGWDVIFVPVGETRTFAEMPAEEKNAVSHRSRAFALLRAALDQAG